MVVRTHQSKAILLPRIDIVCTRPDHLVNDCHHRLCLPDADGIGQLLPMLRLPSIQKTPYGLTNLTINRGITMSGHEDDSAEGLFHAAKRRKIYRKKIDPDDNEEPIQEPVVERDTSPNGLTESALDFNHDQKSLPSSRWSKSHASSIQEILRHRKAVQRRRAGIEFSNQVSGTSESSTSTSLVPTTTGDEDGISPDIKSVISRFAPQAGQVFEETDKHMYVCLSYPINIPRHSD